MPLTIDTQIITASDGGRFALTAVADEAAAIKMPVVMLPGSFTGRKFWLSDKGIGLAAYLAKQGFPCWIVERRGMGASPKSARRNPRPGVQEHLKYDLPEVQRLVQAATHKSAVWIGHSFGGILAARAVAESLNQSQVAGMVLFAAQFEVGKIWMNPPFKWLPMAVSLLKGDFPGPWAGIGPEDEPAAAIWDNMRWLAKAKRKPATIASFANISSPILAVASAGDVVDPAAGCKKLLDRFGSADKIWLLLGKAHGHAEDYSHPGMVISKAAQREVWPMVADWLSEHS